MKKVNSKKAMAVKYKIPVNVSDQTARFIRDVLKELNKKEAIQNIDLGAINMLTMAYEAYLQASETLLSEGILYRNKYGDVIPHPAQTIMDKSYRQVMGVMTEYGLTIKSRTKIKTVASDGGEKSPLDQFFAGKEKR